jgi:hypothetical protein
MEEKAKAFNRRGRKDNLAEFAEAWRIEVLLSVLRGLSLRSLRLKGFLPTSSVSSIP